MKKLFGLLCIVHWPLSILIMSQLNLYPAWHFSDKALEFDFLMGVIHLLITIGGFSIFYPKAKLYISLFGVMLFTFYQVFAFGLGIDRYMTKLNVTPSTMLVLEKFDSGALSGDNFVLLLKLKHKYGIFLEASVVESYDNVRVGRLESRNGVIVVTLEHFNKQTTQETIPISELTMH